MKIWNGYGSEHSANLIMIGTFKTEEDAVKIIKKFDRLKEQAQIDSDNNLIKWGGGTDRFSEGFLALMSEIKVPEIFSEELEQFLNDNHIERDGNRIEIRTDEVDISAFLKIMVLEGAKVEVYSKHEYKE